MNIDYTQSGIKIHTQPHLDKDKPSLTVIDGDIPLNFNIPTGASMLIISHTQSYLTHGLHKFPAKFFPELPRWVIRKYSKKEDIVLDPMAGSGTVNIECLLERRNSIAIDIDPFARLLIKVKTTPLDSTALTEVKDWLVRSVEGSPEYDSIIPDFPLRDDLWFKPYVSMELGTIKGHIERIPEKFQKFGHEEALNLKDFFAICFSSIIREVSNADTHCTRTVVRKNRPKNVPPGQALKRFKETLGKQVPKMEEFSKICPRDMLVRIIGDPFDARYTSLPSDYIELAITSPPYINAVDYPRTHKLEMHWLEIVNGPGELTKMKKEFIGTETVATKDYRELHTYGNPQLDKFLEDLYKIDPRRSYIVYKFFRDMKDNLKEMRRILKSGGRYFVVVGNNRIRGMIVPTHDFLLDIAQDVGFVKETYFSSNIIRHFIKIPRPERILNDWVLVFKKP